MIKRIKNNSKAPRVIVTFLLVLLLTFAFDGLTKYFIFKNPDWAPLTPRLDGSFDNPQKDFGGIIGVRSLPHDNSTVFSFLEFKMNWWSKIILNFALAGAFTFPILFTRSTLVSVGLGIIVGGILGNGFDIFSENIGKISWPYTDPMTHYVRDIFYTPWADLGTFNVADVAIVLGAGLLFIWTLITLFKRTN